MNMKKHLLGIALMKAAAAYASDSDESQDFFKLSGDVRLYSFTRDYTKSSLTDLHSTSLGGKIKAETTEQDGFGAALGMYFAQDIGLNNHAQNNKYINPLLMGTDYGIYTPGEAYVQYKKPDLLARLGNQIIDNPWINPSDGFMIPNLYRAGLVSVNPIEGLKLEGERIKGFKNRTVSGFQDSNLFALPYDNPKFTGNDTGSSAFGATYKNDAANANIWLYRFNDFAQMAWFQGGYRFALPSFTPFVDFQYMKETGDGAELLGRVDSRAYGAKIGASAGWGNVYFAYNKVPVNFVNGVSNGNLLSPYTQVYNTDPLYTTVMNYGLVSSRGAGHAWKAGVNSKWLNGKLDTELTLSRYDTDPYVPAVNAVMVDVAYHLEGALKGVTLRDRLGYEQGLKIWGNTYIDNRIMLQYAF
jgi:hypothetical protein